MYPLLPLCGLFDQNMAIRYSGTVMKEYEITYIVDPSLAEEQRGQVDGTIDMAVTEHGGTISSNSESIRRRLNYPIRKQHVGFARTLQTSVDPAKINELRDALAKNNSLLRLSIIQTAQRPDVSTAIFEAAVKDKQVTPQKIAAKKPAKAITDEEVTSKIDQALDEEVK